MYLLDTHIVSELRKLRPHGANVRDFESLQRAAAQPVHKLT